jgi:hypothetical protein
LQLITVVGDVGLAGQGCVQVGIHGRVAGDVGDVAGKLGSEGPVGVCRKR